MHAQAKKDMQHHMNILQHRLAKMQGADQRAEKAERAQRDMAREIKRLRAALESLTKDPPPTRDAGGTAPSERAARRLQLLPPDRRCTRGSVGPRS